MSEYKKIVWEIATGKNTMSKSFSTLLYVAIITYGMLHRSLSNKLM